jgi:hypothetical protein
MLKGNSKSIDKFSRFSVCFRLPVIIDWPIRRCIGVREDDFQFGFLLLTSILCFQAVSSTGLGYKISQMHQYMCVGGKCSLAK